MTPLYFLCHRWYAGSEGGYGGKPQFSGLSNPRTVRKWGRDLHVGNGIPKYYVAPENTGRRLRSLRRRFDLQHSKIWSIDQFVTTRQQSACIEKKKSDRKNKVSGARKFLYANCSREKWNKNNAVSHKCFLNSAKRSLWRAISRVTRIGSSFAKYVKCKFTTWCKMGEITDRFLRTSDRALHRETANR